MTIPDGIRHFPQSTLLVAVDSYHVKGYLAHQNEVHNVFVVDVPEERRMMEKQHITAGDTHTAEHVFHDHVAKEGAKQLSEHAKQAMEIMLFIPAKLRKTFMEALAHDVVAKITHTIEGDVTHETPVELAKRLTP